MIQRPDGSLSSERLLALFIVALGIMGLIWSVEVQSYDTEAVSTIRLGSLYLVVEGIRQHRARSRADREAS